MKYDLKSLLESCKSISKIQEEFDKYQKSSFPARTPEFFCLELNGEAGELANIEKKAWKGKVIEKERFEDEAADVLIALLNYCNAKKLNLADSVTEKLKRIEEIRSDLEQKGVEY